ncbi:hypothetical protein FHY55_17570 [Oceanicola sp. D3]|uniref:hypothetical protein n=1 Tax=Oceanicola sp. D3 TaxID=2587163 RepID=UPI00111D71D1|nr:hypothetical protein [Oceanicola sp. D3]QDC10934.1 hypothetical protein FHY55_17570 [Oceanicola sp. D3]
MIKKNSVHAYNLRSALSTYLCDQEWDAEELRSLCRDRKELDAAILAQLEYEMFTPRDVNKMTGLGQASPGSLAAFFSALRAYLFSGAAEPDPDDYFD